MKIMTRHRLSAMRGYCLPRGMEWMFWPIGYHPAKPPGLQTLDGTFSNLEPGIVTVEGVARFAVAPMTRKVPLSESRFFQIARSK